MDRDTFAEKVTGHLKNVDDDQGKKDVDSFLKICQYISGQYDEDESFQNLNKEMERIEGDRTNIQGLPMLSVVKLLRAAGFPGPGSR